MRTSTAASSTAVSLLDRLERLEIQPDEFGHRQHVEAAWAMLERQGLLASLSRFPRLLRRFAEHHGAARLYHETVTWLWLFLIDEARRGLAPDHDFTTFAEHHEWLLGDPRRVHDAYYSTERLSSEPARRSFVLPDRAPASPPGAAP